MSIYLQNTYALLDFSIKIKTLEITDWWVEVWLFWRSICNFFSLSKKITRMICSRWGNVQSWYPHFRTWSRWWFRNYIELNVLFRKEHLRLLFRIFAHYLLFNIFTLIRWFRLRCCSTLIITLYQIQPYIVVLGLSLDQNFSFRRN